MTLRLACRRAASRRHVEPTEKAKQYLAEAKADYAASPDVRERMDRRDRINRALYGGDVS